jgi:hypothetical protein
LELVGCQNTVIGEFLIIGQIGGSMASQINIADSRQQVIVFGNVGCRKSYGEQKAEAHQIFFHPF